MVVRSISYTLVYELQFPAWLAWTPVLPMHSLLVFSSCYMLNFYITKPSHESFGVVNIGKQLRLLNFIYPNDLINHQLRVPKYSFRCSCLISIAISSPRIRAWYSVSLLEKSWVNVKEWGRISLSDVTNTSPAPAPSLWEAPSKYIFQRGLTSIKRTSSSGNSSYNSHSAGIGWSARKSAVACLFTVFLGMYVISNCYNWRYHLPSLSERTGLDIIYFNGFTFEIRRTTSSWK